MTQLINKGTWVEISCTILAVGERAPHIPDDTQKIPLEMRVKGYLEESVIINGTAEIITTTGRRLHGTLIAANPAYTHGFGAPIPELSPIGEEVRVLIREADKIQ